MNKTELIKEFAKEGEITQDESRELLEKLQSLIEKTLKNGEDVTLMDLGKFEVKEKKAREYSINGVSGVSEAGKKVAFSPFSKIKNVFK